MGGRGSKSSRSAAPAAAPAGPPLTGEQQSALDKINALGGEVKRSFLGGWMGNVSGIKVGTAEQLVAAGRLTRSTVDNIRRTRRSGSINSPITTYTVKR